jgi:hypothetical protein
MHNLIPQFLNTNYERINDNQNINKLYPMVMTNINANTVKPIIKYCDLKKVEQDELLKNLDKKFISSKSTDDVAKIVEGYDDRTIYGLICGHLTSSNIQRLLESKNLKFDVNYKPDNNHNILTYICSRVSHGYALENIVKILRKKEYNFNNYYQFTILDRTCSQPVHDIEKIKLLLSISEYDITISVLWLYALIQNCNLIDLSIIVCNGIVKRPDFLMFLNNILEKYAKSYKSVEKDIMLVMNLIGTNNKKKLIEMVQYSNNEGNNILHIASMFHLDGIIRNIMMDDDFNKDVLLVKNKGGLTPYNLYDKYDVKNLLFQSVTLF